MKLSKFLRPSFFLNFHLNFPLLFINGISINWHNKIISRIIDFYLLFTEMPWNFQWKSRWKFPENFHAGKTWWNFTSLNRTENYETITFCARETFFSYEIIWRMSRDLPIETLSSTNRRMPVCWSCAVGLPLASIHFRFRYMHSRHYSPLIPAYCCSMTARDNAADVLHFSDVIIVKFAPSLIATGTHTPCTLYKGAIFTFKTSL